MTQPEWFRAAMAVKPVDGAVSVDGSRVHYLRWGRPGGRPIVLVHGGSAHARWWSHLAPLLHDADIVAPDLPGHGESDWTDAYTLESLAKAVAVVTDEAGFASPPVLIGHSLGGLVAIVAASLHPARVSGLVVVDTSLAAVPVDIAEKARRGRRDYPAAESPASRFRLMPPQPHSNSYILDEVAVSSAEHAGDRWSWRFDPRVLTFTFSVPIDDSVRAVRCRSAVFRAEHSQVMSSEEADRCASMLGDAIRVEIPDAHHHLILDQPLAFIAATRTLLATWKM